MGGLALLAIWSGCAEVSRSNAPDLGRPEDLSAIEDASEDDFAVEQPDLTIACDMGAGFKICGDKCIGPDQCCASNECPTPQNGAPLCNMLNQCDVSCNSGYKACNGSCIPSAECCSDGDCTTPGDNCKLVQGATCAAGVCNYPPVQCPYTGQFCDPGTGNCVCPGGQHPCVTVVAGKPQGQCIPDNSCCTNNDCTATSGQVCPSVGGACTCTAGFRTCNASHSCILSTACCDNTDCTVAGQMCSGAGGSCNCPSMQKACGAACIPIANCCSDSECNVGVTGSKCSGGSCGCPTGTYECDSGATKICIMNGSCCPSVACAHSGEVCSGIGGTCACTSGNYLCGTACIPNGHCCANSQCTITGQSCVGAPNGICQCPSGQVACGSKCISNASGSCCTSSDCSLTFRVASATCTASNLCAVNNCSSPGVDVNRVWSDGCECTDDAFGKSCGVATSLGVLRVPGQGTPTSTSASGVLPLAGEENWFQVTFSDSNISSYHPKITISGDANVKFDVFGSSCSTGVQGCADGSANLVTTWEVQGGGDQNAPGCPSTDNSCSGDAHPECAGRCSACCTSAYSAVGSVGTVLIRVRRNTTAVTCNSYTLSVSN